MKIAFVCDAVYPFSKGGKEKRLYDVTQILSKTGYKVDIYTMKWWGGPDSIEVDGVQLHALCRNYPLYEGKRRSLKQGMMFGLACFKLVNINFDVVDVDQIPFFPIYSMWIVCLLRRKKLFATWHEVWGKEYWRKYIKNFAFIASLLERISAHLPAHITAVSETTAKELDTQLNRHKNVTVIPNAVDFLSIRSVRASKNKQDIIFAARLLDHKHAEVLIQSILKLKIKYPDILCLIIGAGPEEEALKQLVRSLRLEKNIFFQGFFDNINDLYAAIKSSRVYVLPSEREGFGIGLLEANACGTPAVTVDSPHNAAKRLILEKKNGSVTQLNPTSIAKSIEYWLNNRGTAVEEVVKDYDWKFMVNKLQEQYSQ